MLRIITGDCRESLRSLPEQSVHCCVTSPPYFGLRDYGVDGQIGLEETPDAYVSQMVEVFREVRRVLRDDGTLWLNLGDSYARNPAKGTTGTPNGRNVAKMGYFGGAGIPPNLKEKDLIGIPWRVAFALQADGWYLRQDIIWHKPNPMPESVRDRCTKAHEYMFLLSKGPRYYFDAKAISEPTAFPLKNGGKASGAYQKASGRNDGGQHLSGGFPCGETRNRRSVWTVTTKPYAGAHFATFPPDLIGPCVLAGCPLGGVVLDPFGGSGTTAGVALKHARKAVLCELNEGYVELMSNRIESISGYDVETWEMI